MAECYKDYLGVVGDLLVVIGEKVSKLSQVNLGSRLAGEIVESAPPALEFLVAGLGIVLRGAASGALDEGGRP